MVRVIQYSRKSRIFSKHLDGYVLFHQTAIQTEHNIFKSLTINLKLCCSMTFKLIFLMQHDAWNCIWYLVSKLQDWNKWIQKHTAAIAHQSFYYSAVVILRWMPWWPGLRHSCFLAGPTPRMTHLKQWNLCDYGYFVMDDPFLCD